MSGWDDMRRDMREALAADLKDGKAAKLQEIEEIVHKYDPDRIGTYLLASEMQKMRREIIDVLNR